MQEKLDMVAQLQELEKVQGNVKESFRMGSHCSSEEAFNVVFEKNWTGNSVLKNRKTEDREMYRWR